jgi:hypothetical protein
MGLSRSNQTPNFFHFNNQQSTIINQQSSIDNQQSDGKNAVRWLTHTGREVPPSGLKPNSREQPNSLTRGRPPQTPRPLLPRQSPGAKGGQAFMNSSIFANISVHWNRPVDCPRVLDHDFTLLGDSGLGTQG